LNDPKCAAQYAEGLIEKTHSRITYIFSPSVDLRETRGEK
jgi:hypothetical protein